MDGLKLTAWFAGMVHGVVVQMTRLWLPSEHAEVTSRNLASDVSVKSNFTQMAGLVFSLYSTSASARAVCAP